MTIVLAIMLLSPVHTAGQQPTFKAQTDVVSVFATVVDRDGRFVSDLTAADFEVIDEGTRQPLETFSNTSQPLAMVVALDTSLGATLAFDEIRDGAEDLVVHLWPQDAATVCAFNDKIQCGSGLTGDRDRLAQQVRDVDFGNGSRLYDALFAGVARLERADRRRVIVVFTTGYDTSSRTRLGRVVERARAADVTIHIVALDTRQLDDADDGWDDDWVDAGPEPGLKRMATDTGGNYFELERTRDLRTSFGRIAQELHRQYVLAFSPSVRDGRVHSLKVRVRRPGTHVRARRTYLAARSCEVGSCAR